MIKHNVILHFQEGGSPNFARRNTNREPSFYLQLGCKSMQIAQIYIFYFCRLKGQEASEAKQIIEVNQLIEQNEKEKPTNSKGLRFAKVIGNLRLPGLTKPLLAT